jgi:thiamine pyrophosphate-dependent acetolactate synthase large subunit-like protein
MDRRSPEITDNVRDLQQWRLPHHQTAPEAVPRTDRFIGMDFVNPPIEFAALARSLGMQACRVETPDSFKTAYGNALAAREPILLEVVVDGSV